MIKKILVPIDYNPASLNALETAISIARSNNSLLQILHVSEEESPNQERSKDQPGLHYMFDAMAGNLLKNHGVCTEVIFAKGMAGQVIVQSVYEKKPDLVVMGARGAAARDDSHIGSNTYYVVKNADCPVMIIPGEGKWKRFEKILYPVRPDAGKIRRLDIIKDISAGSNSYFEVFAILMSTGFNDGALISDLVSQMEEQAAGVDNIKLSLSYNSNKRIEEEVLDKASDLNADLLVISATLDGTSQGQFIGPFSERILNTAKIPQLTMLKLSVPALIA